MSKVCIYFESYYVGGLDTFAIQLINNWNHEDDLILMCNASHSGAGLFKDRITNPRCNVEIHDMGMVEDFSSKIPNYILSRFVLIFSFYWHVFYYIVFGYKRLRLDRFDCLHVINGGYPACTSSRCIAISWWKHTGKMSIHNFHNMAVLSPLWRRALDSYIDRQLIKATYLFIGVSKCCAESLRIRPAFKNINTITHIYNGIDGDVVTPSFDLRKELALRKDTIILMMLATYEERKGHKMIIDVLKHLSDMKVYAHLIFLGYGEDSEVRAVKEYSHTLEIQDHVTCLGFKSNAMEYLAQCDFVMIGSQGFESFGLTTIEGMKYHKVVISTNVGGLKEVLANGEGGYLFNPDDSKGMAKKIRDLLRSQEMRTETIEKGYKRYSKLFRAERVSDEYRTILLKTIRNNNG